MIRLHHGSNVGIDVIDLSQSKNGKYKALDVLYGSETFARLNDPECGLYFQGSVYVFDFLKHEIETGKIG